MYSDAIATGIAIAILWQGYNLMIKQRRLKNQLKEMRDEWDRSIDYSGHTGSGINTSRKNYPDLEVNDDFRESVDVK